MAEHKRIRNFNVLSGFSWYIPGAADIFALLLFLLGGALLGNVVAGCFLLAGYDHPGHRNAGVIPYNVHSDNDLRIPAQQEELDVRQRLQLRLGCPLRQRRIRALRTTGHTSHHRTKFPD